jgi:hypothetical protein
MTFVPVQIGQPDLTIPTGPQLSAKFEIVGPTGARVVLNDQNDRDYIGMITDLTGLDSADVRESASDFVQMDGGVHGDFFYGRRPITLSGLLINPISADDRNRRMTALMRATNAMRTDGTLLWTLQNGYSQYVRFRRQAPLRITGNWQKTFQASIVAADPRIYGTHLYSGAIDGKDIDTTNLVATNNGNASMFGTFTIYGPSLNPVISNINNGGRIAFNYHILAGDSLIIDAQNRTVVDSGGVSRYSGIDFLDTNWFPIDPGVNTIVYSDDLSGAERNGSAYVGYWRDSWL